MTTYTDNPVPTASRDYLMEKRATLGEAAYLDFIWDERDRERRAQLPLDQVRTSARGNWPAGTPDLPLIQRVVRLPVAQDG